MMQCFIFILMSLGEARTEETWWKPSSGWSWRQNTTSRPSSEWYVANHGVPSWQTEWHGHASYIAGKNARYENLVNSAQKRRTAASRLFSPHGARAWFNGWGLGYCNRVEKNPPRNPLHTRSEMRAIVTRRRGNSVRGQQVGASKRAHSGRQRSHARTHLPFPSAHQLSSSPSFTRGIHTHS